MTFKDDMTVDLTNMLNTDEFADAGTYSPKAYADVHPSNKSTAVNGIFGNDFVVVGDTESYLPVFDCATSGVSDATHDAKLTIHPSGKALPTDVTYTVRGVQPDGTGFTRLILEAP